MSGKPIAIIARIFPKRRGKDMAILGLSTDMVELEPIVPRRGSPISCSKHPRIVYFDGPKCPCCGLMAENADYWRRRP